MPANFVTRLSLGAIGDSISAELIVQPESVARTSLRVLGLVILFLLSSQMHLWAATGGTISGTVADPTGAVVPGARLKLVNTAQREVYQTTSDQHGFYCEK
jgi:Carboxypeptidase regulatory-like domain